METKKSICRSAIFKKAHSGTTGLFYIFEIAFDNNDKGNYFSKTETQEKFKEGVEVEYTIEQKVNGNYTNYIIKPLQAISAGGFPKGNPIYEHKRTALKCSVELACSGKITLPDISKYADSFMKFLQ